MSKANRDKRQRGKRPKDGHFCPVCRCWFPFWGPQVDEMVANNIRLARELRIARGS